MKAARLVVLTVALAAGGVAAMLAGRSTKPPEVKTAEPPKMATVDVLVAKADIPMGKAITPGDVTWQSLARHLHRRQFHSQERPAQRR